MRRAVLLLALVAACGTRGGVLVEVSQSPDLGKDVDTLHIFVGSRTDAAALYSGAALPEDVVGLDTPLSQRHHTIELVPGGDLPTDTDVRLAVVGKSQGDVVALGILDLPGIPSDVVLRYALELEPVDGVVMTETGCLGLPDGTVVAASDDQDCDGARPPDDCDDTNPQIFPGAYDDCQGASLDVDDDCNGTADDGDADGDGALCPSDCDDQDGARAPGLVEDCVDGIDNDCDFQTDEGIGEICGDSIDNDCDPATPDMTDEICADGADNDCDGLTDEGEDLDGDGFDCSQDCDDTDFFVNPDALESCNFTDDDCDGATDEDANDDGDPSPCLFDCDDGNDQVYPGNPEVCDIFDNDCNPSTGPAPRPCLDYNIDPCAYGFEQCNELIGDYGLCSHTADSVVPDPVCTQYQCSTQDPSGLDCGGQPTHACVLDVSGDGFEVCDNATVALAPADGPTCAWGILGGPMQQGYTVGLLAQGSTTPMPTVTTCSATFMVVQSPIGMQPGTFLVVAFSGGFYDHSEVIDLAPQPVGTCPLQPLLCVNTSGG